MLDVPPFSTARSAISWHPQRYRLNAELHSRPFLRVDTPARLLHFALPHDGTSVDRYAELIRQAMAFAHVCDRDQQALEREQTTVDLGGLLLKYQKHTEFSTLTLLKHGSSSELFEDVFSAHLPAGWLDQAERGAIVAARLTLESKANIDAREPGAVERAFVGTPIARSMVLNGGAEAWADFRIYPDGYSRFLLVDHDIREQQAGRLAQRLFEIETYTMAALLALPLARQAMVELAMHEAALVCITERFTSQQDLEDHRSLLASLSHLAGRVEQQVASSDFRFSAARAYDAMIEQRITELREDRMEGYVQFREFMERRLTPAMNFCRSAMRRQDNLSQRLARASQLLRTSVDVAMQAQNRKLLASMNNRARMQFHLQEMVEVLSSVAVLYYGFGLIHGILEHLGALGIPLDEHRLSLLSLPIMASLLAAFIFGRRRQLHARSGRDNNRLDQENEQ